MSNDVEETEEDEEEEKEVNKIIGKDELDERNGEVVEDEEDEEEEEDGEDGEDEEDGGEDDEDEEEEAPAEKDTVKYNFQNDILNFGDEEKEEDEEKDEEEEETEEDEEKEEDPKGEPEPEPEPKKEMDERSASTLPEICRPKIDRGPCKMAILRYGYSHSTKSCQRFLFGGCKVNSNIFESESACRKNCMMASDSTNVEEEEKEEDDEEEPNSGTVEVNVPGYTKPNPKPESTDETSKENTVEEKPDIYANDRCLADIDLGKCEIFEENKEYLRYYFSKTARKCRSFRWYGCSKNANHYTSMNQCRRKCRKHRGRSNHSSHHNNNKFSPNSEFRTSDGFNKFDMQSYLTNRMF